MSALWADFDPLSKRRATPAAPVTSMEQAEATPAKSPRQSSIGTPSSPRREHTATAADNLKPDTIPNDVSTTAISDSAEATSEQAPDHAKEDEMLKFQERPASLSSDSNSESKSTANDSKGEEQVSLDSTNDTEAAELRREEGESGSIRAEASGEKAEVGSRDEEAKAANGHSGAELAATQTVEPDTKPNGSYDDEDIDPHDAETLQQATFEERRAPSVDDAKSAKWPDKLELGEHEPGSDDEPHHGALRKHSIAAMKELGSPDANGPAAEAIGEDVPFDFQRFMTLLRSRSADPIARYVKSFLQEFSRGVWSPAQQEKIVADFQKFIGAKMKQFEPFAGLNKRDRRNAAEGMEKLVMNRLYLRTFSPKMVPILRTDGHNEDLLRDHVFEEKMRLWGWVEGRHLDINEKYLKSSFIQLAANELARLDQFKSPRDKTICILNCSKVVWALIRQAQLEQNADSFLPLLIYVVVKAQPVHLISNINYIQRFRSREFLKGETAYYLSTLASAAAFIETLDKTSLTITDEEFEHKMNESIELESKRNLEQQHQHDGPEEDTDGLLDSNKAPHEGESSAAVLAASANMLVERMRNLTTKFLEDLSTPDESESEEQSRPDTTGGEGPTDDGARTRGEQLAAARDARTRYHQEEEAARQASREDFRTEQMQRQQFEETSKMLQDMFPVLDIDVVEDVLRQCGTNVGAAVDLCLALVGS